MKKLTKTNIEELANEIIDFLNTKCLSDGVNIYYNGNVVRAKTEYNDANDKVVYTWLKSYGVNPHDYFEYCAYEHILSMSFEGPLYDVLNYTFGRKEEEFRAIFDKYGLYYEFGNAWNLSAYLSDDDIEVEYTIYKRPKETIWLYRGHCEIPSELEAIMDIWYDLSKKEGEGGSCVLGAGFKFEWKGESYFMPAQSPWQGSLSWEEHKDTIRKMLENVGATEIQYDWGRMD